MLHVGILGTADKVSRLSSVDDVGHAAFPSLLVVSHTLGDQLLVPFPVPVTTTVRTNLELGQEREKRRKLNGMANQFAR